MYFVWGGKYGGPESVYNVALCTTPASRICATERGSIYSVKADNLHERAAFVIRTLKRGDVSEEKTKIVVINREGEVLEEFTVQARNISSCIQHTA